jgi:hydroxyacylglutathione hydrolase
MILGQFVLDTLEANAFILGCPDTREAMLIDAGEHDPRFEAFLEAHELTLTAVFITHTHEDHVGGLPSIVARHNPRVYSFHDTVKGCASHRLAHDNTIRFAKLEGRIAHTPGHLPDVICLVFPGFAFTGDALFAGSVGSTATPENAKQQVDAVRAHLFTLPDETVLHCGHGPSTTVGVERRFNPFFV